MATATTTTFEREEVGDLAAAHDLMGELASVLDELRDDMKIVREHKQEATIGHLQLVLAYATEFCDFLEIVVEQAAELREEALMAWNEHPDRPSRWKRSRTTKEADDAR